MPCDTFNAASPDGEADAEVASDTTEEPQATPAPPEPEGAAENDDTDTRRPSSKQSKEKFIIDVAKVVVEGVAGKEALKFIEQAEKTIKKCKKGAKQGAKLGKSARRLYEAQAERRSFKKKCTAIKKIIKLKKIGQTVEDLGQALITAGDVVLLAGELIKTKNPEKGVELIAIGYGMKATGKAIEKAGPAVQKATDVSINAYKNFKNEDYKFGDVSKGIARDLTGKEKYKFGDLTKAAVTSFTGKEEYEFGDVYRTLRKMGSRESPNQLGG